MAGFWPTADADPGSTPLVKEFARIWRDMPKVVHSKTLTSAGWNTTIARDDGLGGANSHTKRNTAKPPLAARQKEWLPSRLIPHRHCPRAELQPAHVLQVDMLR
jgi:hypothetical protein